MIRSGTIVCFMVILCTIPGNSQWTEDWTSTFPNPASTSADAVDVKLGPDGEVYSLATFQNGALLIKYDNAGDTVWSRSEPSLSGYPISLHMDTSGNPIFGTGGRVIKRDPDGNLLWSRNTPGPMYTMAMDAYDDIVLGCADALSWTVKKLDTNGDSLWQKKYPNLGSYPTESTMDDRGNAWLAGPYFDGSIQIVKYRQNGDTAWVRRYSRAGFENQANALRAGTTGDVIVGGFSGLGFSQGDRDFLVLKYDSTGAVAWAKHIDGPDSAEDMVNGLTSDPDGNFYATGALTQSGEYVLATMKLSAAGDSIWMTLGSDTASAAGRAGTGRTGVVPTGANYNGSVGLRLSLLPQGFVDLVAIIASFIQEIDRVGIIHYDSQTGLIRRRLMSTAPTSGEETIAGGCDFRATPEPHAAINFSWAVPVPPSSTLRTGRFSTPVTAAEVPSTTPAAFLLHQNYPNPFNPATVISYELSERAMVSLKVYDLLGREVATLVSGAEGPGVKSVTWEAGSLPAGVYVYTLNAGSDRRSSMMVLMK